MFLTSMWFRYILREFLKFFLLFLFGFYFLYIVIDYSTHIQDFFHEKNLSFESFLQYYFFQFIKRAEILIPLSLLLSTIKVLCRLNSNRELVAFQAAGIPKKNLLRPLFFIATVCTFFLLGINEFILPNSLRFIDKFYDMHLRHSFRGNRNEPLHVLHLKDHSKLIYQYYDTARDSYYDLIWFKTADDIWKMKYLKPTSTSSTGEWVDHLVRDTEGHFEKKASYSSFYFPDLQWDPNLPRRGFVPSENQSISMLLHSLRKDPLISTLEKQEILTQFLFKIAMPFLTILVILSIAPYCLNYNRNLPQFVIYSAGIFAFIAFIAFMDASVILGESNALSSYIAILFPFVLLFSFFGWRFTRTR